MKLKKYDNLSLYLIDEEGRVFHFDTKEPVPLVNNQYLLTTDETVFGVNLKRRFSVDQVKLMYSKGYLDQLKQEKPANKPKPIPIEKPKVVKKAKPRKKVKKPKNKNRTATTINNTKKEIAPNGMFYPYYVIHGEAFHSTREAAKVYIKMSYSAIRRRCKKNADGWFEITGK